MFTDREELARHARAFRTAIERCDRSTLTARLANFPLGSCGDAVPLLGTYLIEIGHSPFDYLLGHIGSEGTGNWPSHAWLQRGNLVVDITADQFPGISDSVIVKEHSEWHKSLNGEIQHKADYRVYGYPAVDYLGKAYHQIVQHIRQSVATA